MFFILEMIQGRAEASCPAQITPFIITRYKLPDLLSPLKMTRVYNRQQYPLGTSTVQCTVQCKYMYGLLQLWQFVIWFNWAGKLIRINSCDTFKTCWISIVNGQMESRCAHKAASQSGFVFQWHFHWEFKYLLISKLHSCQRGIYFFSLPGRDSKASRRHSFSKRLDAAAEFHYWNLGFTPERLSKVKRHQAGICLTLYELQAISFMTFKLPLEGHPQSKSLSILN